MRPLSLGKANARTLFCSILERKLRAPQRLLVSEFADRYRFLSTEASAEPGRMKTSRTPYLREMMDCILETEMKLLVVMAGAQLGKTEAINNIILYLLCNDPRNMIFLLPSIEMARSYSKTRLQPMFRDCPVLKGMLPGAKKDGNSILEKTFSNGAHLSLIGSNSADRISSKPAHVAFVDELDRVASEAISSSGNKEGSPFQLLRQRISNAHNGFAVVTSTPTIRGRSQVEKLFEQSDQRHFEVPCPHCNAYQFLDWSRFSWVGKDDPQAEQRPETVHYTCEVCSQAISEGNKLLMLRQGKWRAYRPENRKTGTVGFHINAFASPFVKWQTLIQKYLECRSNQSDLKVWWNTTLGLPFEAIAIETPRYEDLYARREDFDASCMPKEVVLLTAGIDVQANRLELSLVGWRGREAWVLEHVVFPGCPPSVEDPCWMELAQYLRTPLKHPHGGDLKIARAAIDCGFATSSVHEFVARFGRKNTLIAVKGAGRQTMPITAPKKTSIMAQGAQTLSWAVGSSLIKEDIYGRLKHKMPSHGADFPPDFIHFAGNLTQDYFKQFCSETLCIDITSTGHKKTFWKRVYPAAEALDCFVYASASWSSLLCHRYRQKDWDELARKTKIASKRS